MAHGLETILVTMALVAVGFVAGWLHATVHWWARLHVWKAKAAKWDTFTGENQKHHMSLRGTATPEKQADGTVIMRDFRVQSADIVAPPAINAGYVPRAPKGGSGQRAPNPPLGGTGKSG